MKPWIERRAAEMRLASPQKISTKREIHRTLGRDESIPPTHPTVTELDITLLRDEEFSELWSDEKLRWAIAKQVRDLRLQRGWSQEQLAKKAGMQQEAISRLEDPNRIAFANIETLRSIARAFEVRLVIQFIEWGQFLNWIETLEAGQIRVRPFHEDPVFQTTEAQP